MKTTFSTETFVHWAKKAWGAYSFMLQTPLVKEFIIAMCDDIYLYENKFLPMNFRDVRETWNKVEVTNLLQLIGWSILAACVAVLAVWEIWSFLVKTALGLIIGCIMLLIGLSIAIQFGSSQETASGA